MHQRRLLKLSNKLPTVSPEGGKFMAGRVCHKQRQIYAEKDRGQSGWGGFWFSTKLCAKLYLICRTYGHQSSYLLILVTTAGAACDLGEAPIVTHSPFFSLFLPTRFFSAHWAYGHQSPYWLHIAPV